MALPMPAAYLHERAHFGATLSSDCASVGSGFLAAQSITRPFVVDGSGVFPISGLPSLHIFRRGGPRSPLRSAWLSGVSLGY